MDTAALRRAAERAGILPGYESVEGEWRETLDATRVRLLEALGGRADPLPEPHAGERPACVRSRELLGDAQGLGLWLNLYTLRGPDDFGIGSFSLLGDLCDWAGGLGADFIGLSPLHVLRNHGTAISPYSPLSRLYLNPIYADPLAAPEATDCPALRALLDTAEVKRELRELREGLHIDYGRSQRLLRALWERVYERFCAERAHAPGARAAAFSRFVREHDPLLSDFATFVCLEAQFASEGLPGDWHAWPAPFRSPRGPEVETFREHHARAIEFEQFLQFETDRQLAAAQGRARRAGLTIGLYRDLALGSVASGFDAWVFPGLFVEGVHLGAPPDDYAASGQDWALPPLDPHALVRGGLHPYVEALLDTNLRHTGALRLDHVMGLFRQFWIPAERPASEGAYVRFPGVELLDHVARASQRHRALIVGEDLGTVPDYLPEHLEQRGILSCRLLFFERRRDHSFRAPDEIQPRALVTATTHDFPTLAGYVLGRDLEILHGLGRLSATELEDARRARGEDVQRLHAHLERFGVRSTRAAHDPLELARSVYRLLRLTPCALVGVGLDNLAGETEPVNVPGIDLGDYPSWSRRMSTSVSALVNDPRVREVFEAVRQTRSGALRSASAP